LHANRCRGRNSRWTYGRHSRLVTDLVFFVTAQLDRLKKKFC